ncbi:MAG TPA: type II secretion system F family protein [Steroidobacteraceae bacterium]|nr:type II secretion system F family protein [Steroidobacteraceae bacterium]
MEFRLKAVDPARTVVTAVLDAVDEADARRQLALEELRVISLEPLAGLRWRWPGRRHRIPLVVFSLQLLSLLDAGLSLVEAIDALAERESHPAARRALERIRARLYEGQTLAAALSEHPGSFPPLYVATVRASERTGAMREALSRYIAYQQQADALRKTLVNASIYPLVLLGVGLLVMLFLMGYVVPRFSAIYEDVGSDLPVASRVLLEWGKLLDEHAPAVVVALIVFAGATAYGLTRPALRRQVARWFARVPGVGERLHVYQIARLYRTTGMLLRGGMPAVPALQMSSGLVHASRQAAFAAAIQAVREGQSLAEALDRNGLTTPVAARMLRVGERSGNMGEMMERVAAFCDEELARWVAILTRLIEPALMTLIGLVIGVIVVLMYFPIFQLAGSIQ